MVCDSAAYMFESCWFLWKYILHILTGKCEVERICSGAIVDTIDSGADNGVSSSSSAMALAVLKSLARSRRMTVYRSIVFAFKPFNAKAAVDSVMMMKGLRLITSTSTTAHMAQVQANLIVCFSYMRSVNMQIEQVQATLKTAYDPCKAEHTRLLREMWLGLMGHDVRVPAIEGSSSSCGSGSGTGGGDADGEGWGLVGFQGRDPGTDFRGMGLLGLTQLHHYATSTSASTTASNSSGNSSSGSSYSEQARRVLREANHPRRYFPFAATGINMTRLCVELLRETRLHGLLFSALQRAGHGASAGTSASAKGGASGANGTRGASAESTPLLGASSKALAQASYDAAAATATATATATAAAAAAEGDVEGALSVCTRTFHGFYCETYTSFCGLWEERDPPNIMSFPIIFQEFSDSLRARYPAASASAGAGAGAGANRRYM